ncbi:MAG: type II toxin-antitoxin system VapC family toxin [Bryobacteraceae bacterium]
MNKAFVADASIAVGWCIPAQSSPDTDRLLDDLLAGSTVAVPPLWPYEVANALLILWRRKKLTLDEYSEATMLLNRLSVAVDENSPRLAATRIADIARIHELTVYDAAYLELAVRKQIPLATRDQSMRRAARRLGIPLLL